MSVPSCEPLPCELLLPEFGPAPAAGMISCFVQAAATAAARQNMYANRFILTNIHTFFQSFAFTAPIPMVSFSAPVQNHPVFAPGAVFSPSSGAKPPRFCTWRRVPTALRCKTAPFPHLAPRFPRPPVQNHPVFAPGAAFSPSSGAKPPRFCTRPGVFPALRCKTTPFLHPARCFPRPTVQNHPVFAPGPVFSPPSGAKPPPFRTWHRVFPVLRCKTTPFLHPAPRFFPPSGAKPPRFCTWRRVPAAFHRYRAVEVKW